MRTVCLSGTPSRHRSRARNHAGAACDRGIAAHRRLEARRHKTQSCLRRGREQQRSESVREVEAHQRAQLRPGLAELSHKRGYRLLPDGAQGSLRGERIVLELSRGCPGPPFSPAVAHRLLLKVYADVQAPFPPAVAPQAALKRSSPQRWGDPGLACGSKSARRTDRDAKGRALAGRASQFSKSTGGAPAGQASRPSASTIWFWALRPEPQI